MHVLKNETDKLVLAHALMSHAFFFFPYLLENLISTMFISVSNSKQDPADINISVRDVLIIHQLHKFG